MPPSAYEALKQEEYTFHWLTPDVAMHSQVSVGIPGEVAGAKVSQELR
jgi:hypothetical protein